MSTATKTSQYVEFDEYIDFQLQKTRQSMKVADIATALCGIGVAVLAYLLVFAICDHWVIPGGFSDIWRVALLALLLVGTCGWVGFKVVLPSLRRINQLYAARAIEGVSSDLQSNLINLIDLRNAGREVSPLILRSIEKRAAVSLSHADVEDAVDRQTLLKLLYALVAVVFLFAAYVVFSPKKVGPSIWRALLPTSAVQVATRTQIEKVEPTGAEVPAGSVLEVTADLLGDSPSQVVLKYTTADRRVVDRAVEMRLVEDGLKRYRCVLDGERGEGLMQDLDFRVEAGDAVSASYHVTVIQPPSATITEVAYDFPQYTLKDRETQPSGAIDTLEGTTVTITATTNMPVKSATLQFSDDDKFAAKGEEKAIKISDGTRLTVDWKAEFRNDGSFPKYYRLQVKTDRGLTDPSPAVQTILLRRDVPPDIELVAPKVNLSLFANAIVPILVKARDPDFLLRDVQLFAMKNEKQIFDKVISESHEPATEVRFEWRLADLNLKVGDEVTMYVAARDNKEPFSNRKESQRRVITIIEPGTQKEVDEQLAKDNQKIDEIQQTDRQSEGKRDENDPGIEDPSSEPKPSNDPRDSKKQNNSNDPDKTPRDDQPNEQQSPKRSSKEPMDSNDGDSSNSKSSPNESGSKTGNSKKDDQSDASKDDRSQPNESDPNGKQTPRRDPKSAEDGESNKDRSQDDGNAERRPLKNDGSDDADALRKALERQQQKPGERQPNPNSDKNDSEKEKLPNGDKPDAAPPDGASNPAENKKPSKSDGSNEKKSEGSKSSDGMKTDDPQKPSDSPKSDSPDKPNGDQSPSEKAKTGEKPQDSSKSDEPSAPDKNKPQTGDSSKNDPQKQPADGQTSPSDGKPKSESKPATETKPNETSKTNDSQSSDTKSPDAKPSDDPMSKEPMKGSSSKDDPMSSNGKKSESSNGESSTKPNPRRDDKQDGSAKPKSSSTPEKPDNSKPKDSAADSKNGTDSNDGKAGSESKPGPDGSKPAKPSEMKNSDGTSSEEKSADKEGADNKSNDKRPSNKGGMKDDAQQGPTGNDKDEAQKGKGEAKPNKSDAKSKDPMKGNESKNEGDKSDDQQSSDKKSDDGPKGGKSETKAPGEDAGESKAKDGDGTSKAKNGGKPTAGKPGKLQSRDGNDDGSPSGSSGEADATPDPVNLEDKKKATNLVLQRLKDELERGDVDQDFLKQLGWTEEDLKRFVDRLDQQSKAGNDTPAEQVRRRQFEEMLKSLDLRSSGGTKEDSTKKKRSTSDFGDKQVPVPLEYRDAYKKYADKLSKQKKADAK